ncbi:MAG: hypothetical protein ACFFEN_16615 [Candidatus Thorarchaeota archaeon]
MFENCSQDLSLIFADPNHHYLFSSVLTIPGLKILFRLSHLDNRFFPYILKLLEYLTFLKLRRAAVLNRYSGENFIIEPFDYLVE